MDDSCDPDSSEYRCVSVFADAWDLDSSGNGMTAVDSMGLTRM